MSELGLLAKLVLLVTTFALATLLAELAGAANLGTAMGFGQIAFMLVLAYLLIRR